MKRTLAILLVVAFCGLVSAQEPPKINDDFSALVIMTESRHGHHMVFDGHLSEDYTGRRQRIDVEHVHEHPTHMEILRFFEKNIQYDIMENYHKCQNSTLDRQMHPAFDWVKHAKLQSNPCHKHDQGRPGDLWMSHEEHGLTASLCVSRENPSHPYWLDFRHDEVHYRHIRFHEFHPGRPDDKEFHIPDIC